MQAEIRVCSYGPNFRIKHDCEQALENIAHFEIWVTRSGPNKNSAQFIINPPLSEQQIAYEIEITPTNEIRYHINFMKNKINF